jgi:surface antigen
MTINPAMRRAVISILALPLGLCLAAPAEADPPEWARVWLVRDGHHKHHHHHYRDDDDDRVIVVPEYRSHTTIVQQQVYQMPPQQPVAVARGLPYGFNRGTCDRGLIGNEVVGNVIGGVAGGLLGNQVGRGSGRTAATIGGTLVGVLVGGSVGRSMDAVDQGCVQGALDYLPDNRAISWQGDGANYRMQPTRSWEVSDGRYCREYQTVATVGGRRQRAYGTACRQPDGSWRIGD